MGHHIVNGRFQSEKHPELPPDRIIVSFTDPHARQALAALAIGYNNVDHELATDIRTRLASIMRDGAEGDCWTLSDELG